MISSSSARGATLEPCANTGSAAAIFDGGGGRCGCCFLAAQQVVRQTLSSCDRTERERISNSESSILNDFVEPSIVLQLKHPKFMVEKAVNSIEIGTAKALHIKIANNQEQKSHQFPGFLDLIAEAVNEELIYVR